MKRITVLLDIHKDAWNWWHACNKPSHGVDWKQRVSDEIVSSVIGVDENTAMQKLMPYLEQKYKENAARYAQVQEQAQKDFDALFPQAVDELERITKHPVYSKHITAYLTTFPRQPYSYQQAAVWLCVEWGVECFLGFVLHELLHFQFIKYYEKHPKVRQLNEQQFEYLKESMTVILNYELASFLCRPDQGYAIHQDMRSKLEQEWLRNHDFDSLVDVGVDVVTRH